MASIFYGGEGEIALCFSTQKGHVQARVSFFAPPNSRYAPAEAVAREFETRARRNRKMTCPEGRSFFYGGEGEIRTRGELPHDGFQDRYHKPLGHLSVFVVL